MSSWTATYRRIEAAQRREERAAQKHRRELERRLKEFTKLSALEQARLEVEAYENTIDLLLSVHKEQSLPVDWASLATSLPPHPPSRIPRNEVAAGLDAALKLVSEPPQRIIAASKQANPPGQVGEHARSLDDAAHEAAHIVYLAELEGREKLRSLAGRILKADSHAYTEALSELSPFTNIESLGSSINMIVHNQKTISCELKVNRPDVVPTEVKTLTAAGKLSVKAMPKSRANEIYQDHVCACALRLCREMFAFLPVNTVVVTAFIDGTDSRSGNPAAIPILSVQLTRDEVKRLAFSQLDPSDAIEALPHRGDVRASRRTGQFAAVEPLVPHEINALLPESMSFAALLEQLRKVRNEVRAALTTTSTPKRLVESDVAAT